MTPDWKPILSYAEEERIRAALAAAAASDRRGAPARVEAVLLAGLRRRNRRALLLRVATAGAIAATLLVGIWLTKPSASPASMPAPLAVAQLPPPPAPAQPAVVVQPAPRPAIRRHTPLPRPRNEDPAEFIPVGAWQAYEPIERGAIVRVRLPKSSLPGFGIPVSADRWNESFPADVVLGEDGSMRAIRLVSNVH